MPSNNTGLMVGSVFGRFPGRLGHLFSPGGQRGPYRVPGYLYALDNGRFAAKDSWSEEKWLRMLLWAQRSGVSPRWLLVPDVVGKRGETIAEWHKYYDLCSGYGWPLAFAVQDGMGIIDVPSDADVVFVGGSTEWKLKTIEMWCDHFPRVHIGRVNTIGRLRRCYKAGAESCDGTGYTRGDQKQWDDLVQFLVETSPGFIPAQLSLGGHNELRIS